MKSMNFFKQEDRKPEYYLLNKDKIIASFYVNDILQTATLVEQFKEIPELFNLKELLYRKRIKHGRENLTELLDTMQIKTLRDFLDITLALSVTDTFWVKSVDSDLTWDKISPYAHCFNPVVADIALNGNTELCSWSQL